MKALSVIVDTKNEPFAAGLRRHLCWRCATLHSQIVCGNWDSGPLLYVHAIIFRWKFRREFLWTSLRPRTAVIVGPHGKRLTKVAFTRSFSVLPPLRALSRIASESEVCSKRNRGSDLRLPVADAVVLLEALLSNPVKRQRRDRAVETRCGHAPRAHGAAPAGEIVTLNPDHALHHRPFVNWQIDVSNRARGKRMWRGECEVPLR
jgi:hypothetical protein